MVGLFRHFRETGGPHPAAVSRYATFTAQGDASNLRERLIVRACEEKDQELLEYVGNARALHISTIHGVLNLFLSQVGHLCDLEAGFRILRDLEERQLARVALKKTLLDADGRLDWVEDWSFDQLLSVLIRYSISLSQDPCLRPAGRRDLEEVRTERVVEWRRRMN